MKNKRKYTKENYLKNGTKIQNNNPKNKYILSFYIYIIKYQIKV